MATSLNTGTRDVPLKFARELSAIVNHEWESGGFLSKTTPVTQDLLRFWFNDVFCDARSINFHDGQRQAILNTIYLHEIAKTDSVSDMYSHVGACCDRMDAEWKYALLGEVTFYSMKDRGASIKEILEFSKLTRERIKGTLF